MSGYGSKDIATVKGRAWRGEEVGVVAELGDARDFFVAQRQAQTPVVGSNIGFTVRFDQQRSPAAADAGINHGNVDRAGGKIGSGGAQHQGAAGYVLGGNLVTTSSA